MQGGDMTRAFRRVLQAGALACSMGAVAHAQNVAAPAPSPQNNLAASPTFAPPQRTVANFVPVTDQTLRAPKPDDWLLLRGNYQGWGYSPLDEINKSNVKNLQLVWARVMEPGINESAPIVYNGIMYLGNPADVIQAIDAVSGDLIWEYRRALPDPEQLHSLWGQRKRSIALYNDRVYFVTWDNYVVALDARTGQLAWQTNRGGDYYVSNSTGPVVVDGIVIAGSTCQVAGFGCYVTGHDARTDGRMGRDHLRSRAQPRLLRLDRGRPSL
jgi:alcohol dehydrogenase (cytochrome c)